MRIVIVSAVYSPMVNGVAVFSTNLAKGLAEHGHEVLVLCPAIDGRKKTEFIDGVRVERLSSREFKGYPDQIHEARRRREGQNTQTKKFLNWNWGYERGFRVAVWPGREVRLILDDFKPEVVHVQVADMIGQAAVRWARQHRVPIVATEHNQPAVLVASLGLPKILQKRIERFLDRYFVRRLAKSDFATMPTEQAIRDLVLASGKELGVPLAAVSNGVDLSMFHPGKVSPEVYKKYGLDPEWSTVIYVGRIDPEKKVDKVIVAFRQVQQKLPKTQLVIVGDGVALSELKRETRGDKNIRFLGRIVVPELYEIYRLGTVFVTASEVETQGIVLIEAAATGLPLVAVDRGAVREVCQNERNGFLCQPGRIKEMAVAMERILGDKKLQKKYREGSIEVAKEHSLERTIERFENIYQRVIGKQ